MLYTLEPPFSVRDFLLLSAAAHATIYAWSYVLGLSPDYDHLHILFMGIILGQWSRGK